MKIAWSKTREQFPLSYKKIYKKALPFALNCVVTLVVGFIALFAILLPTGELSKNLLIVIAVALACIEIIVVLAVYFYQKWYFSVYFYDLTGDYVVIKKGPITPKEITIPYERIQDVYVDQDIFDRIMGLYDVHLSSATVSSGIDAHIDGVEKQAAEGLRDLLLKTIQEKINKTSNNNKSGL